MHAMLLSYACFTSQMSCHCYWFTLPILFTGIHTPTTVDSVLEFHTLTHYLFSICIVQSHNIHSNISHEIPLC